MMDWIAGADIPAHYAPFLIDELQLDRRGHQGARLVGARTQDGAPKELKAIVIGAGMSGLLAGIRLQAGGRSNSPSSRRTPTSGGTWFENIYPGCRVDNPNHMYSYSFEPSHDFPQYYSTQPVLLDYFRAHRRQARPSPPHPLRHRGRERASSTRRGRSGGSTAKDGGEALRRPMPDQRRRPAQPAALSRHRGPRDLRRADLPLRPLAPRRRSDRQAGGGDRHRRQRLPVRAADRAEGRASGGVPAHAALAAARPDLSPRRAGRVRSGCSSTCPSTTSGTASGCSGV